jgi:catechol 2,3-dioxygenase-like lactoylglutathione lyase family enzyme
MKILFCSGFSPLVRDPEASLRFYRDTLGITLSDDNDGYPRTDALDGLKHFGLWSLADAAESCFGAREWPADVPVPQGNIEFDVEDSDVAVRELEAAGYQLLVAGRVEPWGQTVTRLLSPEGLLIGITVTPWMRSTAAR